MKSYALSLLSILVVTSACGDDGGTGTGGSSSTGPGSTSASTSTSTGPGEGSSSGSTTTAESTASAAETTATTGETSIGDTTAGETTAASTGGTTTGGMATLEATMSALQIFEDCMPIVAPDPVGVMFTLELSNPGDVPASAMVSSATFFDAVGAQVATIDVMPAALGPVAAGDSTQTMVTKVADSLVPALGCGVLLCNQSYTLELALDVDGLEVIASDTANVDCVF